MHIAEYIVFEKNQQASPQTSKRPSTSTSAEIKIKQSKLNFPSISLLQYCADLVTNHGRPLSIFKDKAMQDILSMIPGGMKIYPDKVKIFIEKQAEEKRAKASEFLSNKLLSLEFDFAENMGRSFLGMKNYFILQ